MNIYYKNEIPSADDLYQLYEYEGWNDYLKLPKEALQTAMLQSWHVISVYYDNQLIGTGRIISDGIMNSYLCGLVVHPDFRGHGIGTEMVRRFVEKSLEANMALQLLSEENNTRYYERLGFEVFTLGMKHKMFG